MNRDQYLQKKDWRSLPVVARPPQLAAQAIQGGPPSVPQKVKVTRSGGSPTGSIHRPAAAPEKSALTIRRQRNK